MPIHSFCDNMSLVYRYRTIDRKGSPIKRPMISVEFINGERHFTAMALLDSGADSCAISSDMAKALGINTDGERGVSMGVAGSIESVNREINIRLSGAHEQYNLRVPVRVIFIDEKESGSFVPLLGRAELFDSFKIIFDQKKSKITLKPDSD